jgi:hypothetical protein
MRRLRLLALALFLGFGCATESDKAQWNEALEDWRGDNMKMRSDTSGDSDTSTTMKPRDLP